MLQTIGGNPSKYGNAVDKKHSAESTEMTYLRPRGNALNPQSYTIESTQAPPADVVYLEREIMPNDTLQSFALLYGCTVNDIKRANSLINEQDFFALRRLKIPVKRHGLLTEQEEELKRRPDASSSLTSTKLFASSNHRKTRHKESNHDNVSYSFDDVYHNVDDESDSADTFEIHSLLTSKPSVLSKDTAVDHNDASKFLKNVDKEIRKTVKNNDRLVPEKNEVLEEVVSNLGSVGYHPLPFPESGSQQDYNGSSWGLKWSTLILCFIAALVVIILIIVKMYVSQDVSADTSTVKN